ncbi:MAG: type II toxin-antitoxin system ParD family antitoxin [Alphaproteobacteria bacterium]|nr:type II toxin-antitoxin system ParD family antitoxin [Alphaproteobacteria bacterium]
MPERLTFALDETLCAFITGEVAAGRFASANDVVGAGLRLLADQRARLLDALDEGEASGTPTPFDFDAFLASKRGA